MCIYEIGWYVIPYMVEAYICVCMYTCIYYVYIYIFTHVCMHKCMCIYLCIWLKNILLVLKHWNIITANEWSKYLIIHFSTNNYQLGNVKTWAYCCILVWGPGNWKETAFEMLPAGSYVCSYTPILFVVYQIFSLCVIIQASYMA